MGDGGRGGCIRPLSLGLPYALHAAAVTDADFGLALLWCAIDGISCWALSIVWASRYVVDICEAQAQQWCSHLPQGAGMQAGGASAEDARTFTPSMRFRMGADVGRPLLG